MFTGKVIKAGFVGMMGLLMAAGSAEATVYEINSLRAAYAAAVAEMESLTAEIADLDYTIEAAWRVSEESMQRFKQTGDKYYYNKSIAAQRRAEKYTHQRDTVQERQSELQQDIAHMAAMIKSIESGEV